MVGKASADGVDSALDPAASDGTETAAGILYTRMPRAVTVWSLRVWPAGITDEQKTAAVDQLAGLDITLRTE